MGITRASFILFLGSVTGMGGYYLFQVYMSRNLTPAEFGVINALQALFFVISAPANIFAQSLNKHFGQFFALKKLQLIKAHYSYFFKALLYFSLFGLILYFALGGYLGRFLKIQGTYPILITGIWIFSFFFLQLNQGFLQGAHQFTPMSISLGIQGGFRWIFGVLLVVAGFGLNGALSAQPLAFVVAYGVTLVAVSSQFPKEHSEVTNVNRGSIDLRRFLAESSPIFFALLAFMTLTNMDMILVKHYLSSHQAGMYSSLAVLGRGVLFLSEAIAVGMFSIGVHESAARIEGFTTYHKAVFLCVLMYSGLIIAFWIMPDVIMGLVFGEKYVRNAPFLKWIGISMACFGLLRILINFNLSRNRYKFILFLYVAVIAEIILIALFHESFLQIILVTMFISGVLLISNEIYIIRDMRKGQTVA
jgi:O-antigen/teichoic acid export membrane protein